MKSLGELDALIRQQVVWRLRCCGGNKDAAARQLGIGHATIHALVKRFEIDKSEYAQPVNAAVFLVLCLCMLASPLAAQPWWLSWWASDQPEVIGYNIWQRAGTNWVQLGTTSDTNFGPVGPGCYAISAYADGGESKRSTNLCAVSIPVSISIVSSNSVTTVTTVIQR